MNEIKDDEVDMYAGAGPRDLPDGGSDGNGKSVMVQTLNKLWKRFIIDSQIIFFLFF